MSQIQRSRSVVQMDDLVEEVCWRLVSQEPVARIGFVNDDGPQILPVNFALVGHTVVVRTSKGSMLDAMSTGQVVVVEVDALDDALRTGWSVIIRGHVEELNPDLLPLIENTVRPWAGGEKDRWFCVRPATITGRAISRPDEEPTPQLPYMPPD